jgi:hypothetical protein
MGAIHVRPYDGSGYVGVDRWLTTEPPEVPR